MSDVFTEYKREFYRLRYEFFRRGEEPKGECLDPERCGAKPKRALVCPNCYARERWEFLRVRYSILAMDPDEDILETLYSRGGTTAEFTIKIDMHSSLSEINKAVDEQAKGIKEQIRAASRVIIKRFHSGYRSGKKDTLEYWRRCLDVYDRQKAGKSWEAIGMAISPNYRQPGKEKTAKPKGTLTRDVRDDHTEADRLIESALNGKFPH